MNKLFVKSDVRNEKRENESQFIGSNLSFEGTEAYKRLRANLLFSFTDEAKCHIIGVTSSLMGEGKSTTSANIAYSLAEMGKHVLLIDADMRRPNVHCMFNLDLSPGLSNLLVGLSDDAKPIQQTPICENLYIMSAGDIPPNPSELLESKRMETTIKFFSDYYDFIIIDLPPVEAVADALVVSKYTNGIIVVVRDNYVDKKSLDRTVRQLQYHEARIIGFVLNGSKSSRKDHYKKYTYDDSDEE